MTQKNGKAERMESQEDLFIERPPFKSGITADLIIAGAKARDEALERVATNAEPWFELARKLAPAVVLTLAGEGNGYSAMPFSAEELRLRISQRIGTPHHSNAWGALVSSLVKDGTIVPTSHTTPSARKSSHAHRTPLYYAHAGPKS